jgi:hypothetical protein
VNAEQALYGAFFVKEVRQRNESFLLRRFLLFDLTTVPSSRPALCSWRRAQEPSRLAVAPTFPHAPATPGHTLTAPSTTARLPRSGWTIRGELAYRARIIAPQPCIR